MQGTGQNFPYIKEKLKFKLSLLCLDLARKMHANEYKTTPLFGSVVLVVEFSENCCQFELQYSSKILTLSRQITSENDRSTNFFQIQKFFDF